MDAVEKGQFDKIGLTDSNLSPDVSARDLDSYLKALKKEAFDPNDESVVLIDPSENAAARYNDILLPCERENRTNNTLAAP